MIAVKIAVDCLQSAAGVVMDIGASFDLEKNIGRITKTYKHGNAVLMVNEKGEPVSFSVKEAEEIDSVFAEICQRHVAKIPLSAEQKDHVVDYCRRATIEILEIETRKRFEMELSTGNLELAFA